MFRPPALALSLACLVAGAFLLGAAAEERALRDASDLAREGRFAAAEARAADVGGPPAGDRAWALRAYAALARRDLAASERAFRRALGRRPQDWALRRDHARTLLALGRRAQARDEMARALALNPRLRLPPGFVR